MLDADFVVTGEMIAAVTAPSLTLAAREVVDVASSYVLPGANGAHVHSRCRQPMAASPR